MTNLAEAIPEQSEEAYSISLEYSENPAAKKMLDAFVSILAQEFIQAAKNHPDIFSV
jgi:hypothetical protein